MPIYVTIYDQTGSPLNAKIEVAERGLVLHSRSGSDRNRDYREALETVLTKLDAAGVAPEFYLDSQPVQAKPLDQRKLTVANRGSVGQRFDALVKEMNAGSKSNGAWRRILISASGLTPGSLAKIVESGPSADDIGDSRLPVAELNKVTSEHIDHAVQRLLTGDDAPNFEASRDYDLLVPDGRRLAPKKVFGLALSEALSIDALPVHFSAGLGTPCFNALENAGYPVVLKDEIVPGGDRDLVDPDLAAAEGTPKLMSHLRRERKPALAAAKRQAMKRTLGHLQCERCHLIPSQSLGSNGDAVIEVHHSVTQIANMKEGHVTRLDDLTCLCANCHRIVHREIALERT